MLLTAFKTVPPAVFEWLRYPFVITEKLKTVRKKVEMQVLSHQQVDSNHWEQEILGIKPEKIIRRDIVMRGDNLPCWFARTMIPQATYKQDQFFFDRLRQEPLSHLIFNEPRVCRYLLRSYAIDKHNLEYEWVTFLFKAEAPILWMRLSYFLLDEHYPFYLAEIFLPALL